ncbi:MAG: oxygen-independent coproporphyrinogen III oxidase, partial [Verrucomicrobia bacterium]|nr:oxygen-independent coproporphyrinogen III oxidase [Verrucomicrobiota bacterium]
MMPADLSALIGKYNRPGPRYTSYPTALQFTPVEDADPLLQECHAAASPLSLYVHLPFCESLCWFCACTTVITCNRAQADEYLDALEREIDLMLPHLHADHRPVNQLHLGGGSPSFLTAAQLRRLGHMLRSRFRFTPDAECSAELDPRTLDPEKVAALAEFGCNRASIGVQDIHPEVQQAIHRVQPDELNRKAVGWIREAGIHGLNLDLVYGLPHQSVDRFRATLDAVLTYRPDRFAVFSYAHVPWVAPAQKILEKAGLPDPETKFRMLMATIERLTGEGYRFIGMDHFAREDDDLAVALREGGLHRNFQGYTTRAGAD